ncbi:MAG TPA: FAD-binding oxidoreductase [Gemmatimonas aurantiaca]|uniref:FAD-binding oxidoreductase n=2 Tax=Gemmatimonas aurantiaca TaxID=173480 RepID=A0A3D4V6P5_9BACT|nr:FAD-binding oxidoreductase [Gemmatimonas aurantiaca]BAH38045.1 putative oxidoreductase [Gemmatimonas aurantiaca T-27]HCT56819.1 FAD-binding oxidoreductase [Gemmatimonas aurantiaca]
MTLTSRRRLRRGESVWAGDTGTTVFSAPLPTTVMADVIVVGAGISGALVTRALRASGRDVVMVDRKRPIMGSTMASTALLQYELDLPLHRLAERIGWSRAARAWRRSARAVQELGDIVRIDRLRCQFAARDSLYVAGTQYGHRALAHEAVARERAGLRATFLNGSAVRAVYGVNRTGAIVGHGAAVAHPARLTAGLLRRAVSDGVRLYHDANVIDVDPVRGGVLLSTDDGRVLIANHVVFCCGYQVPRLVPPRSHRIRSTWALAAEARGVLPSWLRHTVVWEASDPYLYLRTLPDGSVVAGGRDERDGSAHADVQALFPKARLLRDDVEALLPGLALRVTHRWAGAFGESPSSLPLIDRLPGHSRAWVVAGFGGNGITFSVVASQIVAAALRGERDPDASLFTLDAHLG